MASKGKGGRLAKQIEARNGGTFALRFIVVIAALAVLYWRTPVTFMHPQFWAEDRVFFQESRLFGWESLPLSAGWAGYLGLAQVLVAHLANCFRPELAGAIYCYSAILLTLSVVWLAMSPRLDMPAKPLLALAIVIVPMGYEELGALCNIQWILPIGGFLLMFMRPARARLVLYAETLFLGITALTGPFSIFLTPLFMFETCRADETAARRRLMILTVVSALGALIQVWVITHHSGGGMNQGAASPYPWSLWIDLPFRRWMTDFGPVSKIFQGKFGAVLGIFGLTAGTVLASLRPFRAQKLAILFFALAIAFSGMYKFHNALATQVEAMRYFYAGSVLLFSFISCLSSQVFIRRLLFAFVASAELMLLPAIHDTPRFWANMEWPAWARYMNSGLAVVIPTEPEGSSVILPASKTGPLSKFASWQGQNVAKLATITSTLSCKGYMNPADRIRITELTQQKDVYRSFERWIASGTAWDGTVNQQAQLVVITDATGTITGFGLPVFQWQAGEPGQSQPEWRSIFTGTAGSTAQAYAVLNDGQHICPLSNQQYLNDAFPPADQPRVSATILRAIPVNPGKEVEQSFRPSHRLRAISLVFVTGGKRLSRYTIEWRVTGIIKGRSLELGRGQIDAQRLTDWGRVQLPLSLVPEQMPDQINVAFWADSKKMPRDPAEFPLYKPAAGDRDPPVTYGGAPAPDGAQLDLFVTYLH